MNRISYADDYKNIDTCITKSFKAAKDVDEAEFFISLLKHANLSPWDNRNTLKNFRELFDFIAKISLSGKYKAEDLIRLSLLLYCHFFEWSEMFNLFYDLSEIEKGERAGHKIDDETDDNRNLYWDELKKVVNGDQTPARIENARALLNKLDQGHLSINKRIKILKKSNPEIGKILQELFDPVLRNGFSHNSYSFLDRGIMVIDERDSKEIVYSWETINKTYNLTKCFAGCLLDTWAGYLADVHSKHLKGKYCEYKINCVDNKRFRIQLIDGPIPIGIEY